MLTAYGDLPVHQVASTVDHATGLGAYKNTGVIVLGWQTVSTVTSGCHARCVRSSRSTYGEQKTDELLAPLRKQLRSQIDRETPWIAHIQASDIYDHRGV